MPPSTLRTELALPASVSCGPRLDLGRQPTRPPQNHPDLRTCLEFAAPSGPHRWLNRAVFVGTLEVINGAPLTVLVGACKVI